MATEITQLVAELVTKGFVSGRAQMQAYTQSAQGASTATNTLNTSAANGKKAFIDGIGNGVSRLSAFLNGEGSSAMSKFLGKMGGVLKGVTSLKAAIVVMLALTVVRTLNNWSNAANDLYTSFANIGTLIPGQIEKLRTYTETITDLSIAMGKSEKDLADATYQTISVFGDQSNTMEILDIAAKSATAGLSSTADAVNLLSAVSKGYNDTSTEMIQKISDLSFETVRLGKTTFPELASSIGKVVPMANALGVSVEEMYAGFATLTGVTGDTAEVATQLRGIMAALVKPTEELKDLYEKMGVSSGREFIAMNGGLIESLKVIQNESINTGNEMASYIRRVEGLNAMLALTGSQSTNFAYKLGELQDATGATDKAFKEVTDGINRYGFQVKQLKSAWDSFKTSVGAIVLVFKSLASESLIPTLTTFRSITNAIGAFTRLVEALSRPLRTIFSIPFKALSALVKLVAIEAKIAFQWLYDIITGVYERINEKLAPTVEKLTKWFKYLKEEIVINSEVWQKLKEWLDTSNISFLLVDGTITILITAFNLLLMVLKDIIIIMATALQETILYNQALAALAKGDFGAIKDIAENMKTGLLDSFESISDNWKKTTGKMREDWASFNKDISETELSQIGKDMVAMYQNYTINTSDFTRTFANISGSMKDFEKDINNYAAQWKSLGIDIDVVSAKGDMFKTTFDKLIEQGKGLKGKEAAEWQTVLNWFISKYGDWYTAALKAAEGQKKLNEEIEKSNRLSMWETKTAVDRGRGDVPLSRGGDITGIVISDATNELVRMGTYLEDELAVKLNETFDMGIDKSIEFAEALRGINEELQALALDMAIDAFESLGAAFSDGKLSAEEFGQILADMAQKILDILPSLFVQAGLQIIANNPSNWALGLGFIAAGLTSAFVSGLTGSLTESSKGNVFENGTVKQFSSGGIVDKLSYFPMANGGIGSIAEGNKAEAIMPLERGADGKLGVKSTGSSVSVKVNVVNQMGSEAEVEQKQSSDGSEIWIVLKKKVKNMVASGDLDKEMTGRYNTKIRSL